MTFWLIGRDNRSDGESLEGLADGIPCPDARSLLFGVAPGAGAWA